jgi:hypothetical protein
MKTLPCEILLEIASHIKNMWCREDYLKALGIDHLYYKGKSRPVSKTFVPKVHLPTHTVDNDLITTRALLPSTNPRKRFKVGIWTRHTSIEWFMITLPFGSGPTTIRSI